MPADLARFLRHSVISKDTFLKLTVTVTVTSVTVISVKICLMGIQCLKWSEKEAESLPQSEVEHRKWYRPAKSKGAGSLIQCDPAPH